MASEVKTNKISPATSTTINVGDSGDTLALATDAVTGFQVGSDAQGDVLYHDGTDYTRLGAGTSGHFLKTQGTSANPVWAAAGFDSIALLSSQDASTSASVNFDNTLLTSDYNTYEIRYFNVVGSADGTQLQMHFSDDNGSNFDSNHTGGFLNVYTSTSAENVTYDASSASKGADVQKLNTDLSWDAGDSLGGMVTIQNPSSTSFITTYQGSSSAITHHATLYNYTVYIGGIWDSLAAVNYIRFDMSSGNIVTGTFQLWGYK